MRRLTLISFVIYHWFGITDSLWAQNRFMPKLPLMGNHETRAGEPCLLVDDFEPGKWQVSQPKTIYRISDRGHQPAELLALVTLQGLLAKQRHADGVGDRVRTDNLYFDPGSGGYDLWLSIAEREFGVEIRADDQPWKILNRFASVPLGYVLCDMDDEQSVNLATSLAGPMNGVVIDVSIERKAKELGWKRLADARARDLAAHEQILGDSQSSPIVVLQRKSLLWQLKDLAVLANSPVLSSSHPGVYQRSLKTLGSKPMVVFGWGDSQVENEDEFIGRVSRAGGALVPADHVRNLSVLAGFRDQRVLTQKNSRADNVAGGKNVHTVTFVFTDGDNLGWLLNDFPTDQRWFGSKERGQIPVGWGMPPMLAAIFPAAADWYYREASQNADTRDVFIAGPSGAGYCFPSQLPPKTLEQHSQLTAKLMHQADLGIMQVIDTDVLDQVSLWDAFTQHEAIDGIIYLDYSAYDKERGEIVWSNGKPVVSAAARLWKGQRGADLESLVRQLSAAPRRSDLPNGYSIVMVHAWSHSVASVVELARRLPAEVEILAPDAFFRRISNRLGETK